MNLRPHRLTALAVFGALFAAVNASPASAARHLEQAANYTCDNAQVAVSPPRVWASGNRPEMTFWLIQLERWNGRAWTRYSQASFNALFDYYGRSVNSWSVHNTRNGGRYINSRMRIPVSHRGYYRVASSVVAPRVGNAVYVGGSRNYCYVR
jgi:hypothetical protein